MNSMGRQAALKEQRLKDAKKEMEDDFWDYLVQDIVTGLKLTPIISNTIMNNRIFDIDNDGRIGIDLGGTEDDDLTIDKALADNLTIDEALASKWSSDLGYPLQKKQLQLCQVAQYNQFINSGKRPERQYLQFLKGCLLDLASKDEENQSRFEKVTSKPAGLKAMSFSQLAFELGYPKLTDEEHPLLLMAQLPIPIFITTSHHDFLERALVDAGKDPHPQICSWYGRGSKAAELDHKPTPEAPLVYYLYGRESEPDTMVLSEDDYLDFLVKTSKDSRRIFPVTLKGALSDSSLLLLGYRLGDWDLRVLLRSILSIPSRRSCTKVAIQLDPQQWEQEDHGGRVEKARGYLKEYFKKASDFQVKWDSSVKFIRQLKQRYEEVRS